MRILIVEDDPMLGQGLRTALKQGNYAVELFSNGEAALSALRSNEEFALVILDLGLPDMDGIDVLKEIRDHAPDLPVLILTARDAIDDRVRGLDSGADDYLTKPFDIDELAARMRVLLRRHQGRRTPNFSYEDLVLDPRALTLTQAGKPLELTRREFSLLQLLMNNLDKPVTKQRLTEQIYEWDESVESNAIEVHIHNLRKKLGRSLIHTVRGVGYRFGKS